MTDNITTLDYTLNTVEERVALVNKIAAEAAPSRLTPKYLTILGNYILDARSKEEKRDKTILTDNRMITINKREVSYEELAEKLESGEDGIYNLIQPNKEMPLTNKTSITDEDVAAIPELSRLRDKIAQLEREAAAATGKQKYILKKTIIDMRRDQYILKNMFNPAAVSSSGGSRSLQKSDIELDEDIYMDENKEPVSKGLISFFSPAHISAILCHYDLLLDGLRYSYNNDFHYLMRDFQDLMAEALAPYPLYQEVVNQKVRGKEGAAIKAHLLSKFGTTYTVEYISVLWRKKIPKIIAEKAKENYINWYYTYIEPLPKKTCSKCGQTKLAHNRFFSRNNTSKDGWYSLCKSCRNKKKGGDAIT